MFEFLDRQTPEVARLLYGRASDAAREYAALSLNELSRRAATDFAKTMHWVSSDQVAFHFEDLPDFSFMITYTLNEPVLSIQAGGRFWGFILQRSGDTWFTHVRKPLRGQMGSRAKRLAICLQRLYGIGNIGEKIARARGRFNR